MSGSKKWGWTTCDWVVVVLLCLITCSCQPGITPSLVPTPQVIELQTTSSLRHLQPWFKTCIEAQGGSALVMQELPAPALDTTGNGLALRWGSDSAPAAYAAVIGYDDLVMIVHPANPLNKLDLAALQAMYSGTRKQWSETSAGDAVKPWSYPAGEDIQSIFYSVLLKGTQPARSTAFIAPDPQAMLEAVSTDPGAIGFIPRRWLSSQVKEISIDGIDRSSLRQPILALTQSEPEGQKKQWLLCLQAGLVK
jgi:hypothetical protein